ncbi:CLUMA_CG017076, isoform A [Clunio marinus]|uniref:CLUMA_CG017076, isoform A n=1 Tax=Clunio marinus TaxID=568069 RepID=A0A1J1IUL6_9DIPT|nr:CLUMA_CG017076, isoform A [Clunio marinus]
MYECIHIPNVELNMQSVVRIDIQLVNCKFNRCKRECYESSTIERFLAAKRQTELFLMSKITDHRQHYLLLLKLFRRCFFFATDGKKSRRYLQTFPN